MENLSKKYLDKKKQEVIVDNILWNEIKEYREIVDKKEIELIFSSFDLPSPFYDENSRFNEDTRNYLNIWCDNAPSDLSKLNTPNIIIDHHTYETKYPDNFDYTSNCDMIMRNFGIIYSYLKEVFYNLNNGFQKVNIFIHTDMDGIFSGMMIKYIITLIYNDINITKDNIKNYKHEIILPYVLGEMGDISSKIENIIKEKIPELNYYRLQRFQRYCNRLFKGFKNAINVDILRFNDDGSFYYNDLEHKVLRYILALCNSNDTYNKTFFYYFINCLDTNPDCLQLVSNVEFDINNSKRLLESLTVPIIIKFDDYNCPYYFFTINSNYDVGRSVLWSYKGSNSKSMNFDNMGIMVYNQTLKKLSSHSFGNDTSYNISKDLFNGGGHILKNGDALGSCEFKDISMLNKFFKLAKIQC